jgi:hypothetical protein
MSAYLNDYTQDLSCNIFNKEKYGEIFTPFHLIEKMLDLLPPNIFSNPNLKWLDPCTGKGAFLIVLYKRLFSGLSTEIKEPKKRHSHIIEKMLYMVEINPEHIQHLYSLFGENANIINDSYFNYNNLQFDIIIGNPPFNVSGSIKTPTNTISNKTKDGKAIWREFVINSIQNLQGEGILLMITPSIWMKRDDKLFNIMKGSGTLEKIHTLSNTETNNIFNKQAQTPTCYFVLKKREYNNTINIWDNINNVYFNYLSNLSLPLKNISIISKILMYTNMYSKIHVIKTNMPYKSICISNAKNENPYKNINTCRQINKKPTLVINYSDIPCKFHGIPKLVLAHKMYGFPYYDISGTYGVSNRDNYVITGYSNNDFIKLRDFLHSKFARVIFDSTRYRMMYLEKYAFEFIPDITKIKNFPLVITEDSIADFFNLNIKERNYINEYKFKSLCS